MEQLNEYIATPTSRKKAKIKANTEYVIFDAQIQRAIKHIRGSEILAQKLNDWYEYFKSIKSELRANTSYQVNEKVGINIGEVVYYYFNDGSSNESKDSNNMMMNNNGNIQHLSDSFNYQNSLTFQTLQDELRNKNEYVATLQDNLNNAYSELGKKDSYYFEKMRELQDQIIRLEKEKEKLESEAKIEKRFLEMEKRQYEKEKELEQKFTKKEKALEESNSFNLGDILNNLPTIANLVGTFSGKSAMPQMAGINPAMLQNLVAQQQRPAQQEPEQEQENNNIKYPETEFI